MCFIEVEGGNPANDPFTPLVTNRSAAWVEVVQPTTAGAGSGEEGGPSSANEVNLATGMYSHDHGLDMVVRNPVGPDAAFGISYSSATAITGYRGVSGVTEHASPGLPTGWTHNYDVHVEATNSAGWNPLRIYFANGLAEDLTVEISGGVVTGRILPQAGSPYSFVGTASSSTVGKWASITMINGDQSRMVFTPVSAGSDIYRLTSFSSILGQAVEIVYDGSGRISTLRNIASTANNNNSDTLLTVSYSTGSINLTDVSTLRNLSYSLTNDRLTAISNLGNTRNVWSYSYQDFKVIPSPSGSSLSSLPLLSSISRPRPDGGAGADPLCTIAYAGDGSVNWITDANGNKESYLYQSSSNQTIVIAQDAAGNELQHWTQKFDSTNANRDTGTVDIKGNPSGVYYTDGSVPFAPSRVTNENGQQVESSYDHKGNVTASLYPNGNGTGNLRTHYEYEFDATVNALYPAGRIKYVSQVPNGTDPTTAARKTSYTYYPNGLVETARSPAPYLSSASTPSWFDGMVYVRYEYTALGNVQKYYKPQSRRLINTDTQLPMVMYEYFYTSDPSDPLFSKNEALGEPVAIRDPLGHVTHYRYNAFGQVSTFIDAVGNTTDFIYNAESQLEKVVYPGTGTPGNGRAYTLYTYAYVGGPLVATSIFNEYGTRVDKVDSTNGGEAETTQVDGGVPTVKVGYNGTYRIKTIADGKNQSTSHNYDAVGNMTSMVYPDNNKIEWTQHDNVGNVLQVKAPNGQIADFTRLSGNSAITNINYPGKTQDSISYTYDIWGNVTSAKNKACKLNFAYDAVSGYLIWERPDYPTPYYYDIDQALTNIYGAVAGAGANYIYNLDGSLASSTADGTLTYDLAGRLIRQTFEPTGSTPYSFSRFDDYFIWSDNNLLIRSVSTNAYEDEIKPGSYFVKDYEYDNRNRLKSTAAYSAFFQSGAPSNYNAVLTNIRPYATMTNGTYDAKGNLLSYHLNIAGQPVVDRYGNFLTSGLYPPALTSGLDTDITHQYNAEDRVVYDSLSGNYSYDAAGNLTSGGRTYNINNQLDGVSYDANGNPASYANKALSYDAVDHVTNFGYTDSYAYRPDGLRAWRDKAFQAGGETYRTFYNYAHGKLISREDHYAYPSWEVNGQYENHLYFYDPMGLSHVTEGAGTPFSSAYRSEYIPLYDLMGNTIGLVDCSLMDYSNASNRKNVLKVQGMRTYSAYGVINNLYVGTSSDAWWTREQQIQYPFLYKGEYGYFTDWQTGLILCGHRYYDPSKARWLIRDPIGYEGGINLYAYCSGNPVMNVDPSGLVDCEEQTQKILQKMKLLQEEIDKYDPVSDGRSHPIWRSIGGRKTFLGNTTPGGHYNKIKRYQAELAKQRNEYYDKCGGGGGTPVHVSVPIPARSIEQLLRYKPAPVVYPPTGPTRRYPRGAAPTSKMQRPEIYDPPIRDCTNELVLQGLFMYVTGGASKLVPWSQIVPNIPRLSWGIRGLVGGTKLCVP